MGAYLSSPICDKETVEGSDGRLAYAASSMQGWRMSQEDAHNSILNYDDRTSLFAVYDGHGGAEIALYCSRHLPDFLKQLESYRQGRLSDALTEGFLQFDSLLLEPAVKEILRVLADDKEKNDQEGDDDEDDDDDDEQMNDQTHDIVLPVDINEENNHPDELNAEEAQLLKNEAEVPIEELLKRYSDKTNDQGKHFHSPSISIRTSQNPLTNKDEKKQAEKSDETVSSTTTGDSKTDVDTHEVEKNVTEDDASDQKVAETTTTAADAKPSSSEPKTTARRARKSPATTDTTAPATKGKSKSLTHHLLSGNIDELEEEDEDEDDYEFDGSDDETSGEEAGDPESGEESAADEEGGEGEEGEEETEEEEEEEETEGKPAKSSKTAQMKKLMRKSIMAILNRRLHKKKRGDDSEDDAKENQHEGEENNDDDEEDNDDQEQDEEDEEDEDGDADLGKMLDMSSDPGSSSGCTAVLALLRDKQLYVANAGDSRCVVCRAGRAIEMSFDHKPEDPPEKSRIEKAGYKVTLDGRVSGGLNLSRAIGDHAYKKTSALPAEEQAITALPDIRTLTLEDQDEFMIIACDGIWNFMSSQDAVNFVRERLQKKSLSQICEELFMHCLAPNTSGDGTGCDNMTAIIVKFNFHQSSAAMSSESSAALKATEHSPWPTMFASVNNKRALSPDPTSTSESADENESKKFKNVAENGAAGVTSPSKTAESFSFIAATNTMNNNSNADPQH